MNLVLKLALRELKGGIRGLLLFLSCLVLGVAIIAGVGSITESIEQGILDNAKSILGGDVSITLTSMPATETQKAFFESQGDVSLALEMRAMALFNDASTLVELKGVGPAYPLYGSVESDPPIPLADAFKDNGALVDQAFLDRSGLTIGDRFLIGNVALTIRGVLLREPDRIVSAFSFGPRVLTSVNTAFATELTGPESIVRYRYRIMLKQDTGMEDFTSLTSRLFPEARWQISNFREENPNVGRVLSRVQLFLTLAGLSTLLIGGIGIATSTSYFLEKKSTTIAIFKSVGANETVVFKTYLTLLLLVGVVGIVLGIVLGAALSYAVRPYIASIIPVAESFHFYRGSSLLAAWFGILNILTFSLIPLARGVAARPSLLFRGQDIGVVKVSDSLLLTNIAVAITYIATVLYSSKNDPLIAIGFIGITGLSLFVLHVSSRFFKGLLKRLRPRQSWFRLASTNLHRPRSHTTSILIALGIGLTILTALTQVEAMLQRTIRESIPSAAPSLFLIDIQPEQYIVLSKIMAEYPDMYDVAAVPMALGDITHLAGKPLSEVKIDPNVQWAVRRERGFTASAKPPFNTVLTKGEWWAENYAGPALISLDESVAKGLGLSIGDAMTINVAGKEITGTIHNLRQVNYSTFQINFALILSPGQLDSLPHTYISTAKMHRSEEEGRFIRLVAEHYPNISIIRVSDAIAQVQEIVRNMSTALRITIFIVLISGMLVLVGAFVAAKEQRRKETVICKVLGADRNMLLLIFATEWVILGLIASVISSGLGVLAASLVATRFETIIFTLNVPGLISTSLFAILSVLLVGMLLNYHLLAQKPSSLLRND